MTVHQCPKCELRFNWKTEVDDHCWHDHPEFRHEYPAGVVPQETVVAAPVTRVVDPAAGTVEHPKVGDGFVRWLVPRQAGRQSRTPRPRADAEPRDR